MFLGDQQDVRREILDKVVEQASQQTKAKQAQALTQFIWQYYSNISIEDLNNKSISDLYAQALSMWQLMKSRKVGETNIRIFNPSFEEDGWTPTHTIVQIVHDDMPFLIDTLRMELTRLGFSVHLIVHIGGMQVIRDKKHHITDVLPIHSKPGAGMPEAPIHIEIDRRTCPAQFENIQENLLRVLADVKVAVSDWQLMKNSVKELITEIQQNKKIKLDKDELAETVDFLGWLANDYFTFLGCRDYRLTGEDDKLALEIIDKTGLGVLRHKETSRKKRYFNDMPPAVRNLLHSEQMLLIAKSNTMSTVHRPVYTDYISIKRYDEQGNVFGERRFVGLFTSLAYHNNPEHIPFLRNKAHQIVSRSHLSPSSHAYKELRNIIEVFPRDDLFQGSVSELYEMCMGILRMQDRPRIRLFGRKDIYGRFMSCLLYVPREEYNAELRRKIVQVLETSFSSSELSYSTRFSESLLACLHFMIRIDPHNEIHYDIKAIEQKIIKVCRSWRNDVEELLHEIYGEEKGNTLIGRYINAFPAGYREAFTPRSAVLDIRYIEQLTEDSMLGLSFYHSLADGEHCLRFKLFSVIHTTPLSDVLPILENMGLRVIGEEPYGIKRTDGKTFWINDFSMMHKDQLDIDVHELKHIFQDAFRQIWFGLCENDGLNCLALSAKLHYREISLLRAYTKYLRQTGFTFSQTYIEETFASYPNVARLLVDCFHLYFDPAEQAHSDKERVKKLSALESKLNKAFDRVDILDQDRILRQFYAVLQATVRTNFYQKDADGKAKPYICFKFLSAKVPGLPLPKPLYEIFVFSPQFEGIHLRCDKVARGGLRWSDRREDFRTEILGLMKAQQVKNAVIVPHGAKGGFVAKRLPLTADRDIVMEEVITCYKRFISGLLDVTDNYVEGKIQPPENVVRYDDDDPYLVVAADKGTATFSDIANSIAKANQFWLGDAFASGGSTGYDHKKMGITARGAWESVKRHFRTLAVDIQSEDFTVVGIGDMAGDVFGNGMLLSEHIRLVAAFNHLHIFVDPNPDAATSFAERKRLFELPRSQWTDYDKALISQGGGIFNRSAKSVKLSPEIKKRFDIKKDVVVPNELLQAILKAEVDLLWNGGIGTFIKASNEHNRYVGDRTNDSIRIDGKALRCRVIGEGGNLGCTQLARVEFALNGGLMNTDFIDNAAGVDCSDHEVNIKILLNDVVRAGEMTIKQRNDLLAEMTDEVALLVLSNNYRQAQTLNISMHNPPMTIDLYERFIEEQVRNGDLDRELEFLPDQEALRERKAKNQGFTLPELAVLMSYSKNILQRDILATDLPEDEAFAEMLAIEFPEKLCQNYWPFIQKHRLRREIIATHLSSQIINCMGIPFIYRLRIETGAEVGNIVKAYMIAYRVFDGKGLWAAVEALDSKIEASVQVKLFLEIFRLLQRVTRWILKNRRGNLDIGKNVDYFSSGVMKLTNLLPNILIGTERAEMDKIYEDFTQAAVPKKIAMRIACNNAMFSALDIIVAANKSSLNLKALATIYFELGDCLELSWLKQQVRYHPIENHWDGMARSALRDDLDYQQSDLSISVLRMGMLENNCKMTIDAWLEQHKSFVNRWRSMLADLRSGMANFTVYLVAARELMDLIQNTINEELGS